MKKTHFELSFKIRNDSENVYGLSKFQKFAWNKFDLIKLSKCKKFIKKNRDRICFWLKNIQRENTPNKNKRWARIALKA